jgi:hypothetical protein
MIALVLKRWHISLLLYVFVVSILVAIRPALMFKADGSPKKWGGVIDEETSIFAPAFMIPLLAVLCYFVASMVEMMTT